LALGGPLKLKKFTALAAVALATVALSGCSLSRDIASLDMYAPSDGVQLDIEQLKARNVMLIKGASGNAVLIGSFVNSGTETITATIQTEDGNGEVVRVAFEVGAGKKFDLGYNGTEGVVMPLKGIPGSIHPVFLNGSGDPIEMNVPILDGTLAEYRPFVESLN
jgi:hypothetical protein